MGASIQEIAKNAQGAAAVAGQAVQAMESTTATVSQLGDSSRMIGDVVKTISSIAEQTNLLALNATIEAARAGEAGKGFAVVANEVKELSQETARATDDIARRVETIQTDTTSAVAAIADVSRVITQMHEYQVTISAAVEEQTATTDAMNAQRGGGRRRLRADRPQHRRRRGRREGDHRVRHRVAARRRRAVDDLLGARVARGPVPLLTR